MAELTYKNVADLQLMCNADRKLSAQTLAVPATGFEVLTPRDE